jgi:eukaryotic-like serine/threonine-protein kinase
MFAAFSSQRPERLMQDSRTTVIRKARADAVRPAPSADSVEELATQLAEEMLRRWRAGERPLPEEMLDRHPLLWDHPEAAADLIYEELCLRQEFGLEIPLEQVLARFPQWQQQLAMLFDCQRVLGPRQAAPDFPTAGESLGDFLLLAELGRGAHGRVFVASQLSLGDRPVVLKVTPLEASEHLTLARLQHTHIVPLYSVQDDPERRLRALCMPYFGGATLAQVLDALRPQPPAQRTGQNLLDALDRAQAACPLAAPARGPARQGLGWATYTEAVCWIGACLAEALHYAHERGLVHLDVKPSNILLAADAQPMLLDFHLAREPIRPDEAGPPWLGGTAGYLSPEQEAALLAAQRGHNVAQPVDGRSDLYSLGLVLYEALTGDLPAADEKPLPVSRANPAVSVGLADVIGKCLATDAAERYPHMAALALDLRRHLEQLPLAGVRNRSLSERWRKWRRRQPHGPALAAMMLAVFAAAGALALGAASHFSQRLDSARAALHDAQSQLAQGQWAGAIRTLEAGLAAIRDVPGQRHLSADLNHLLQQAEQVRADAGRADAARALHQLADRARLLYGAEPCPPSWLRGVEASCHDFWDKRAPIVKHLRPNAEHSLELGARDDLLDLAILWADLQVRLTLPGEREAAQRRARVILAEAEALFGPSLVLDEENKRHGAPARSAAPPRPGTAWEHYALGRALLCAGALGQAAAETAHAAHPEPPGLWPNFYQGQCAYRQGRFADAVTAYSVCIGAAPDAAGCFFNRALAYEALGRPEQARHDYDQAARLAKEN